MARTAQMWGRPAVRMAVPGKALLGVLVGVVGVLAAGCGSSGGAKAADTGLPSAPPPAAPAGLGLPCQPGSGQQVTSPGPMNMTNMAGQQLGCAVFDHLTMNQVNLGSSQLPGAAFRSSTLNSVNFNHASLIGAAFDGSTLNFPDFTNADLRGANLTGAHLNSPVWTGATCPDGTPTGTGADCATHLNPLPLGAGPAATSEPPASSAAATVPPVTVPPVTVPPATVPPATSAPAAPANPPAGPPAAPSIFNGVAHGTYRCTGGNVLINGAGSTLHLVGQCSLVVVNGDGSHVEIDAASRILVNGTNAQVIYHSNAHVFVNGAGASAHRV